MASANVQDPSNPLTKVLILGNHEHIAMRMIDEFRKAGYDGKYSATAESAIKLVAAEHFDVLIIGGGVTDANASRVEKRVTAILPEITVQRMNLSREPLYWLKKALGR
ncbi:MAG TPA: hypothetical protein EYQ61_03345 [Dehalococcoidia bacterium]|jgi:DNA-binding NtrC family response regulator|nr:hypothetical protein [Dehalococcoidia bacterium]HIK90286.1 hypothetical protein [Dehalococcoidia bacterium]